MDPWRRAKVRRAAAAATIVNFVTMVTPATS